MRRGRSSGPSIPSIGFTGGAYSTTVCKPESTDWYCTLSKIASSIQMILFLAFILFLVYLLLKNRKRVWRMMNH